MIAPVDRPDTAAPVLVAKSGGPSWYWTCICGATVAHVGQPRAFASAERHAGRCPAAVERARVNLLREHVATVRSLARLALTLVVPA